MNLKELEQCIDNVEKNKNQFEIVLQALRILEADFRFFKTSHHCFLPAARDYRNYIKGEHSEDKQSATFKMLRGRLGAMSREMYKSQRETFVQLVGIIQTSIGIALPDLIVDKMWQKFKAAERKWLSANRAQ